MTEALGICMGLAGNVMNAVGCIFQKQGWNRKEAQQSIFCQPTWLIGFVLYAVGSLVFAVALGLVPASTLLPLGGVKLAAFTALAPW